MDFGEIFRVLRRRWRVAVPVFLLTVIAAAGVYVVWPTTYESDAEITLLGSQSLASQPGNGNNPYLVVGDLGPMAAILASNLSSQQAVAQLQARGVTGTLTAAVPPYAAGPFVSLALDGSNPALIRRSMPVVISFVMQQLKVMQENGSIRTPVKGLIAATVISRPSTPAPVLKRKIELVAGVAVLGLVAMFMLTFSAEARANRRSKSSSLDRSIRLEDSHPRRGRRYLPERESVRLP
jgi:Chain length determinant protein